LVRASIETSAGEEVLAVVVVATGVVWTSKLFCKATFTPVSTSLARVIAAAKSTGLPRTTWLTKRGVNPLIK